MNSLNYYYKDVLANGTVVVCGGGPSLPQDLKTVFAARIPHIIAVKHHALFLQHDLDFAVDFVCFLEDPDRPSQAELRTALMLSPAAVKVSPFPRWTDVDLDVPWWNGGFSSTLAVWLAGWMGARLILLAGMDCYQGDQKYFYGRPGYRHPALVSSLEANLAAWRPALEKCPNADRIRAVSGPLTEIFGRWVP